MELNRHMVRSIILVIFILFWLCNNGMAVTVRAEEQHDYTVTTIREATADELGIRKYVCKICGKSYQEYFTLPSSKWGSWQIVKAPTCAETGLEYRTCMNNTEVTDREERIIPATGKHSYVMKEIKPTCEKGGENIYTCSVCGDSFEIGTSELGHLWSEWQVEKEPTCTEDGLKYRICNRESGITHREEAKISAVGHTWSEWMIKKAPTCVENGIKYSVCTKSGCNCYREEIVLATGKHLYSIETTEPTCEKAGKKIYTCSICGKSYEEITPKLNHAYGAWITDKKATYLYTGKRHKICSYDSSHVVEEVIPKLSNLNVKDIIFGVIICLELVIFEILYYPLMLQLQWINRKKRELIKKYIQ